MLAISESIGLARKANRSGPFLFHPISPSGNMNLGDKYPIVEMNAIVKNPRGWAQARRTGLSHGEDSLKRPPRGIDPDHPFIEDLKRTSFTTGMEFTEKQACAADFPGVFVRACRREAPLVGFLAKAMGLRF